MSKLYYCKSGLPRVSRLWLVLAVIITLSVATQNAAAQSQNTFALQGVVLDESDQPFVGVSVMIPSSTGGTTTNARGEYSILIPKDCDSLLFSFIGYFPQTVSVRDARLVRMKPNVTSIDNVVVNGIFSRKKDSYTGSAVSLYGKDLSRVGNQNLFQSLKNLDPSLSIMSNLSMGSDPNSLPEMQLRGTSTFPADETASLKGNYKDRPNTPLFILNGFETTAEKIFDMDMNRVASVTILKDAAAKAIYGSKAANGVVVIETKKLGTNETLVTYNGSVTLQMPDLTSYNLCNAEEKLRVELLEGWYTHKDPDSQVLFMQTYNSRLKRVQDGLDTDWLAKPLRTGIGTKHAVSVELGEKALKTLANFSYNDVKGVMKGSDRQTITGDIDLQYRKKGVLFRNLMSVGSEKDNDSPYGQFSKYALLNPYFSPYDENGKLLHYLDGYTPMDNTLNDLRYVVGNPLYDATLNSLQRSTYLDFSNDFRVEVDFLKDFKAIASMNVSSRWFDSDDFFPADHSKFADYAKDEATQLRRGSYDLAFGKSSSLGGQFDLQYHKSIKRHNIDVAARFQVSESKYENTTNYAEGFPTDKIINIGMARQYALEKTPSRTSSLNRSLGALVSASYNFADRYMTDLTFRKDASSMFGNDNPWANFWSAGLAWNISNEKFMQNVKWIDMLRVRGSVGTTGNQNFALNNSMALYQYNTNGQYQGFLGAILQNMENPGLLWEEKFDVNVGLDAYIGNLTLTVEYYNSTTRNMVTGLSIAPSTGFNSVRENLGKVRNKGWEVQARYTALQNKDGYLNIHGSLVTNDNRIVKISDKMRTFNDQQRKMAQDKNLATPIILYEDGRAMNTIWAVPSLGIDPNNGQEVFVKKDGTKTYTWSTSDLQPFGSTEYKYKGLFGFDGMWKGIGASVTLSFLGGGYAYNQTLVDRVEDCDMQYNVDKRVLTGRWQTPGQNAQFSSLEKKWTNPETNQEEIAKTMASSRFIQKRNELTLSSVSVYYEFSRKLLNKIKLQQLRLAFYMNDVETWSSIRIERGTAYPFARTMSFSLTGTF